jgi:hypothetical protein
MYNFNVQWQKLAVGWVALPLCIVEIPETSVLAEVICGLAQRRHRNPSKLSPHDYVHILLFDTV